ncbi:organic cation transporter protein-like [Agrilus planipennis]|uniref:Organic cation transporter protein-like n=1 Tax=Agrilus planipennis TaxID=224129 RepID=A0A7F5R3V0_AGRPL|nr:organic cation transporter protein-like [Agrilus planipennis]
MPPQEKFENGRKEPEQKSQYPIEMTVTNNTYDNSSCLRNKEKPSEIPNKKVFDNANDEEQHYIEFDELLPYIGEFGRYQKILFLLMIPFATFVAWVYFNQIFITITPEQYWCWVPELQNFTQEQRVALSIPLVDGGFEKCRMFAVNFTEMVARGVQEADPSWPTKYCSHGWEYNFSYADVPYSSIATEQNWVCDNSALPTIAQAIFFCGAIIGGLVFGWLSDTQGRISALVGTNLIGFVAGVGTAFCNSFWAFCLCRFLVGMAFDNCFTMMYILVLEYVGPKWRTFVANMSIAIFFTFAAAVLPWIAWFLEDWRMFTVVTSVPLALAVLTPWVVPESARWLASQGKVDKAIEILKKFERINGTKVDDKIYTQFSESCLRLKKQEESSKTYSVMDLFKTPRLRRITILLIVIWMAISLVFDGHVRNVGSLGLNTFLTFCIASATEFPADTFLTAVLDVWGRRWLAFGSMAISGVFSLLACLVPIGLPTATLAIIGRFAINITYNIGLQYAAELLPTVVRGQGVAFIHIMGYVASILAPFVVYLANIWTSFPLVILGILGILGGILTLFLPETLGHELPQTLQDGETFGMNQKIFEFPCCMRGKSGDNEDECQPKSQFRRIGSIRASVRGEVRSNIINRSSIRSRKSISVPENQQSA